MKQKLLTHLTRLRNKFPSPLPTGAAEFEAFSDSIIKTYGIPDMPSYRHAIATMIMHLGPQTNRAPKKYFAASIHKAMANEVAFQKIQQIKEDAKKAEKPAEPALLEQPQTGA